MGTKEGRGRCGKRRRHGDVVDMDNMDNAKDVDNMDDMDNVDDCGKWAFLN